jgi:uncharacterized repeat protein (TIGR03803 family)
VLGLGLLAVALAAGPARAGAITAIYSFKGGQDGSTPVAGVTASKDGLYGTTLRGGPNDDGTVWEYTNEKLFKSLFSFNGANG